MAARRAPPDPSAPTTTTVCIPLYHIDPNHAHRLLAREHELPGFALRAGAQFVRAASPQLMG
jgi:hypothetical protein